MPAKAGPLLAFSLPGGAVYPPVSNCQ